MAGKIINGNGTQLMTLLLQVLTLLATVGGGFIWLDARFDEIELRQVRITEELRMVGGDRWRRDDQAVWAAELGRQNGDLNVPEVHRSRPQSRWD